MYTHDQLVAIVSNMRASDTIYAKKVTARGEETSSYTIRFEGGGFWINTPLKKAGYSPLESRPEAEKRVVGMLSKAQELGYEVSLCANLRSRINIDNDPNF